MTIAEMIEKKRELGMNNEMISEASGVPLSTVQKVFGGITKSPRKLTIQAIEKALRSEEEKSNEKDKSRTEYETAERLSGNPSLRESAGNYNVLPKERKYTIDDYYALPEDRRVELIDGVIYDMAAPSGMHQRIIGDLHILFRECADQHGMPCEVFLSPFDVRLDRDNYTMVQPDLLVICGEYDVEGSIRYEGAPDLVIEVLSPSSRTKDQLLKLYKYSNAGVREYWIVDPKYKIVTVHRFEEEEYTPQKYDFEDQIPVGISWGKCVIDFARVGKRPFR